MFLYRIVENQQFVEQYSTVYTSYVAYTKYIVRVVFYVAYVKYILAPHTGTLSCFWSSSSKAYVCS